MYLGASRGFTQVLVEETLGILVWESVCSSKRLQVVGGVDWKDEVVFESFFLVSARRYFNATIILRQRPTSSR